MGTPKFFEQFCRKYQAEHPIYDLITNNCRKFMMDIFATIGREYPHSYFGEAVLYRTTTLCTEKPSNSSRKAGCKLRLVSLSDVGGGILPWDDPMITPRGDLAGEIQWEYFGE